MTLDELLRMLGIESWMMDALCAEADPDAWFPEQGGNPRPAKRICAVCDVREQCLEYALRREREGRGDQGIWGGMSRIERLMMVGKRPEKRPSRRVRDEERDAKILSLRRQGLQVRVISEKTGVAPRTVERVLSKARRLSLVA